MQVKATWSTSACPMVLLPCGLMWPSVEHASLTMLVWVWQWHCPDAEASSLLVASQLVWAQVTSLVNTLVSRSQTSCENKVVSLVNTVVTHSQNSRGTRWRRLLYSAHPGTEKYDFHFKNHLIFMFLGKPWLFYVSYCKHQQGNLCSLTVSCLEWKGYKNFWALYSFWSLQCPGYKQDKCISCQLWSVGVKKLCACLQNH